MTIISSLFPDSVLTAEGVPGEIEGELFPEELAIISAAIEKRQKEFSSGRLCARALLEQLGFENFPLLAGDKREPLWPQGICGSITHSDGYCAAAISKTDKIKSIGLDAEVFSRFKENLLEQICLPSEIMVMNELSDDDFQKRFGLLFSAKEAFYKAQYPLTKIWLNFHDVSITVSGDEFSLQLMSDISGPFKQNDEFKGRFHFDEKYVYAGLVIS